MYSISNTATQSKICDGIMFVFYPGLPHTYINKLKHYQLLVLLAMCSYIRTLIMHHDHALTTGSGSRSLQVTLQKGNEMYTHVRKCNCTYVLII